MDAIHDFGKGENRYLMSVGDTKGKQVEQIIKDKKPKVSGLTVFGYIRSVRVRTNAAGTTVGCSWSGITVMEQSQGKRSACME